MNKKQTFGKVIKLAIEKSGKTYSFWALKLNTSKKQINKWEEDKSIPSPVQLITFKAALKDINYDAYVELTDLFYTPIEQISPMSLSFRSKNLYDYVSRKYLEDLIYTLQTINVPSDKKEGLFNNLMDLTISFGMMLNPEEFQ